MRAGAFYSDVLDMKTTQLILFGMLLAEHNTVGAQAQREERRTADVQIVEERPRHAHRLQMRAGGPLQAGKANQQTQCPDAGKAQQ